MKKITLEMPMVTECKVGQCAYNVGNNCHARAITVGDATHPGCDTFMANGHHIKQDRMIAGIGACKTATCKFNDDFECMADTVRVGMVHNEANCITFMAR